MKSLIVDVHSLPVLPEIADSVIRMALDEEVSVSKIADLIEKDQALTARILSLANSSFYKRSRQVHTVREAVVAIGAEAVRTLALGLCVLNMFPSKKDSALDHNQFWRHCFGCAVYAEAMMNELAPQFRAKAFCAGLLHDIGKLVLDVVRPGEYASVVEKAGDGSRPLEELERDMLGTTHAEVGRDVLAHWKLPRLYEETVWCHHAPVKVIDEDQFRVSGIVHIANILAHMTGIGASGNMYPPQVPASLIRRLSLSEQVLDGLMASVPRQIDSLCEDIGIGKPTEGLFSLVNRAGMRLSEISMRLQQESLVTGVARRRSDILLMVLRELNNTSKITDALARAAETLFKAGLIKGFMGGFRLGDTNLVFEHREGSSPRFIKVGDAEVKTLAIEGGYSAGMSLPSGVFVYLDLSDMDLGDDQDFISSLITAVASSLRRIHAENALSQEKTLLRQALRTASQEKQKTEELMELNRELMSSSTIGLCLVEEKNLVRIENPVSREIRDLLGVPGDDLAASLDASTDKGAALLKEALGARKVRDVFWARDGRTFRIAVRPVSNGSLMLLALWDITAELEEQKRTLAYAKMSVVGSLAASMAHNMKSPLGAIHGFASIIRDDLRQNRIRVLRGNEEDQDLPDMLGNIITASENLLKIVNQLLGFTRKWESPEGEVGLEGFVEGVFQLIGAQASAGGIALVKDVEPAQVRMKAEAMEQVVINLLMNAINASSKGAQVLVKVARKDGGIELAVVDHGIGMDAEQVKKIFDPMYTAWPLKTGMGLGLCLAREIVESMGGRISVTSRLAEGSTFTVWIPEGKEA